MGRRSGEEEEPLVEEPGLSGSHIKRVLQNRALNHRKDHLDDLRRNLNPFDKDKKKQSVEPLRRSTRSLNDAPAALPPPKRKEPPPRPVSFWNHIGCTPTIQEEDETAELICYDSDPEDYVVHRKLSVDSSKDSIFTPEPPPTDLVAWFMNHRLVGKLHTDEGPIAVTAWTERGQRLARCLVSPRFCWQHQTGGPVHKFDLLDVQKVLPANEVGHRDPLIPLVRTAVVSTLERKIWLQLATQQDRDQFVLALKLAVSRFGSKVVAGDYELEEFFVQDFYGPGDQPYWLEDM